MLKVDDRQLKKFSRDLKIKRPSQISAIQRAVLNDQAFHVQKKAKQQTIPRNFNIRSAWITSSILVGKAKGKNMRSEVGAKKKWRRNPGRDFEGMREQEYGENLRRPNINTLFTRGGQFKSRVKSSLRRNKLGRVRKINRLKQIRDHDNAGNKSPMYIRNVPGIKKGIYKFGSRRKGGWRHLQMIQDVSMTTVMLKKRPWLKQATNQVNQSFTVNSFKKAFKRYTR